MSLWRKLGQEKSGSTPILLTPQQEGSPEKITPQESGLSEKPTLEPSNLKIHTVSEPDYWPLGHEEWLPPVARGLAMVYPAADWGITSSGSPLDASEASNPTPQRRKARGDVLCPVCGCPLFWEPLGDREREICVECQPPPSSRIVEDLWLAAGDGIFERVSESQKWKQAAFAHLAARNRQQQAKKAAQTAKDNEGF